MDPTEKVENPPQPSESTQKKREDYICWTDYFMGIALLAAKRSKDPNLQVGACIVNKNNKIVGIGYNGFPLGCHDDQFPWGKNNQNPLDDKFLYVCHAEMNAIINKNSADVQDCTIYVTRFPCNECAKVIIQSGITEVVYSCNKKANKPIYIAAKKMLDAAAVKCNQFEPNRDTIEIKFTLDEKNE